jgi:mannose-6-phosphate isomerase-like protein (cupin superfamily)
MGGVTLKLGADDTAGAASIYESLRPAGDLGGPPLHRHAFDEAFYVLEGEYVFNVQDRTIAASVGSFLYVPAGTTHAIRHAGDGTGRMLTICHPGGIEEIFEGVRTRSRRGCGEDVPHRIPGSAARSRLILIRLSLGSEPTDVL